MMLSDFQWALPMIPFPSSYTTWLPRQMLPDWLSTLRFAPLDLPSSPLLPTSGSCRLYNGRRAACNQVAAALITPPLHKVILPDN